jgi:hypothetical protein
MSHEAIHSHLKDIRERNPVSGSQWAGAWNAVVYRFMSCAEHDEQFTSSVAKSGASPRQPERYIQDRELFEFFVSGLASFEAFHYALFAIGSIVSPAHFPFASGGDFKRVTTAIVLKTYRTAFPMESLTSSLHRWQSDKVIIQWNEIRNILVHRALPGRTFFAGGEEDGLTLWSNGISIDQTTTSSRRKWLANALTHLLQEAQQFTLSHVK